MHPKVTDMSCCWLSARPPPVLCQRGEGVGRVYRGFFSVCLSQLRMGTTAWWGTVWQEGRNRLTGSGELRVTRAARREGGRRERHLGRLRSQAPHLRFGSRNCISPRWCFNGSVPVAFRYFVVFGEGKASIQSCTVASQFCVFYWALGTVSPHPG